MDQLQDYADQRLIVGCIYCGAREDTREHVPSRVFLDLPLPENLPVVGACRDCNNGFSLDEEYLACMITCVIAGSSDPDQVGRERVAKTLRHSQALRAKIEAAKYLHNGRTHFAIEEDRVERVLAKLARGHAVFELSQRCSDAPSSIRYLPLESLTEDQRESFEAGQLPQGIGELGSRGMQRLLVTQLMLQGSNGEASTIDFSANSWVDVQEGRYRYNAVDFGDEVKIKMVFSDYLACEVVWGDIC